MTDRYAFLRAAFEKEISTQGRSIEKQGNGYRDHGVNCMWWAMQWGYEKGVENGKVS